MNDWMDVLLKLGLLATVIGALAYIGWRKEKASGDSDSDGGWTSSDDSGWSSDSSSDSGGDSGGGGDGGGGD